MLVRPAGNETFQKSDEENPEDVGHRIDYHLPTLVEWKNEVDHAPLLPALACDPKIDQIFDLADATKVIANNERITQIGKQLTSYNLIDTGLFYFPKGYGQMVANKVAAGAYKVSHVIEQFIEETGVRSVVLPNATWQDVDNPAMKKQAEKMELLAFYSL